MKWFRSIINHTFNRRKRRPVIFLNPHVGFHFRRHIFLPLLQQNVMFITYLWRLSPSSIYFCTAPQNIFKFGTVDFPSVRGCRKAVSYFCTHSLVYQSRRLSIKDYLHVIFIGLLSLLKQRSGLLDRLLHMSVSEYTSSTSWSSWDIVWTLRHWRIYECCSF
jgi:hypothetical protein